MATKTQLIPLTHAPEPRDVHIAINRLRRRIADVEAVDPSTIEKYSPSLMALQASLDESLGQIFGTVSDRYRRYRRTIDWAEDIPSFGGERPLGQYREDVAKGRTEVLAMLNEAVRSLEEWLSEQQMPSPGPTPTTGTALRSPMRKVFIVHGHEEGPLHATARFLEALKFEVVILNERANRNRTIIEKIEANSDVGFAVVLLTPDDEGAKKGSPPRPRARQNVLLELGYFMAKLTRDRVCVLKRGDVEIPTDFAGVVWVNFDDAGAWKRTLAKELSEHFEIDWQEVGRR